MLAVVEAGDARKRRLKTARQRRWRRRMRAGKVRARPTRGFIYFVQCGEFVKIGWTVSVRERIADLQTGNPFEIRILATKPGSPTHEKSLHRKFAVHRIRGEWFRLAEEIRAEVAACLL